MPARPSTVSGENKQGMPISGSAQFFQRTDEKLPLRCPAFAGSGSTSSRVTYVRVHSRLDKGVKKGSPIRGSGQTPRSIISEGNRPKAGSNDLEQNDSVRIVFEKMVCSEAARECVRRCRRFPSDWLCGLGLWQVQKLWSAEARLRFIIRCGMGFRQNDSEQNDSVQTGFKTGRFNLPFVLRHSDYGFPRSGLAGQVNTKQPMIPSPPPAGFSRREMTKKAF